MFVYQRVVSGADFPFKWTEGTEESEVVDGNIIWKYMTTTITLGFNCNTDKDLTRIDPEKKNMGNQLHNKEYTHYIYIYKYPL